MADRMKHRAPVAFKLTDNARVQTSFAAWVALPAAALLLACSPPDSARPHSAPPAPGAAGPGAATSPLKRCFREETRVSNAAGDPDVLSLVLVVDGDRAQGEYHWLPAAKDRREGHFEGSVAGELITATYEYLQEGRSGTTPITIRVENSQAVVAGGDAALGLGATLPEVEC